MKTLLLVFAACAAFAQDAQFRVHAQRWTNHDFPTLIQSALPVSPVDAKRDGVLVIVTRDSESTAESVEVTVVYYTDGKRHRQSKTATFVTTGCTPEPCAWKAILFDDIGKVDLSEVQVAVTEWNTLEAPKAESLRHWVSGCGALTATEDDTLRGLSKDLHDVVANYWMPSPVVTSGGSTTYSQKPGDGMYDLDMGSSGRIWEFTDEHAASLLARHTWLKCIYYKNEHGKVVSQCR